MIQLRELVVLLVFTGLLQASTCAQEETEASVTKIQGDAPEEEAQDELEGFEDVAIGAFLTDGGDSVVEKAQVGGGAVQGFAQLQENDPMGFIAVRFCEARKAIARRVCDLDAKQVKSIAALDQTWVTTEVKKKLNPPKGGFIRGIVQVLKGPVEPAGDPSKVLPKMKKVIESAIREELNEEQLKAYDKELDAARRFQCKAHAGILTSVLDRHLFLSAEQHAKLQTAIFDWLYKSKKDLYWQFYLQNNNYIPQFPSKVLTEHLTEAQRTALKGMQTWNYDAAQMEWQMVNNQIEFVIVDQ